MRLLLSVALAGCFLIVSLAPSAAAQGEPPSWANPPSGASGSSSAFADPPPPPPPPPPAPVNGALALLALAGGAYAVRRLRDR
jgi:hypothetical protein